ncbi:hypothetical protein K1X12_01350 [Hyphomonas sp. WL0036]|uniref:hypothetical protein n=1 Tax=Hyphomonas sediminis TaxID=2866160 RepID=UPI001C7EBC28|nr:hypothetical protein [Hyphomonas sediminis]MBY9065523.1 hypothetical protein [Hyphomonas sediminis]
MADGHQMPVRALKAEALTSLEDAIRKLEAGAGEGLAVDLGNGRIARADSPRGNEGLLQRLRGHKMLLALASGGADLSRLKPVPGDVQVAPSVREILDAATRKA